MDELETFILANCLVDTEVNANASIEVFIMNDVEFDTLME